MRKGGLPVSLMIEQIDGELTSTAIPGTNMTTASAWKNFRRALTLSVGIRESAASIICVATPPKPSVLPCTFATGSRAPGTTYRRCRLARDNCLDQPATDIAASAPQYEMRTGRVQRWGPSNNQQMTQTHGSLHERHHLAHVPTRPPQTIADPA